MTADPATTDWWSCPYCSGANQLDAASCAHCGARLRDPDESTLFTPDSSAMFTTVAVDNAEVVRPGAPFGPDSMWSTMPASSAASSSVIDAEPVDDAPGTGDTRGLDAAIGRLSQAEQDAAVVPLSVCAVLVESDEIVLAALAGQMLGQPAGALLTTRRVLIVNARRWQPVVDVFHLGADLVVRERHDGQFASLTLSQGERLSTLDAIGDVATALEVAEYLRR